MARRILRGGIRATEFSARAQDAVRLHSGVFCVPVIANFQMTFQWLRELKRRGHRLARGIQFRIDDKEIVFVGYYNQAPQEMTAAQSVAFFDQAEDARGFQVVIPRSITAREITGIRSIPQVTGWRFHPAAKGRSPFWPFPGEAKAAIRRRKIERLNKDPLA